MRDKSLLFVLIALPLLASVFVACLAASSSFVYRHPQGDTLQVRRDGRIIVRRERPLGEVASQGKPKAVTPETQHNFGTMNPLTMGEQAFVVRNEGDAPLRLRQGPTTCKCTLGKVTNDAIAPAEQTTVTLVWNTGKFPTYSHEATIFSNDPARPEIVFRVEGLVRTEVGAEPREAQFGDISPEGTSTTSLLIYSQTCSSFRITGGESSIDGLRWSVEPATSAALTAREARTGYRLTIETPPDLPQGRLTGTLQLQVEMRDEQTGDATTKQLDIPVHGRVVRRLALYGANIDETGTIDLGQIKLGQGKKMKWLAKIRDEQTSLNITRVSAEPSFIQVRLLPYDKASRTKGLAYLEVEIPPDAPESIYLGYPLGKVRVDFDHPRISELELQAKFAVTK